MMTSSVFLVAAAVMMTQAPPQKPLARADLIKNINTHFQTMDSNHDGKLSADELNAEANKQLQQKKLALRQAVEANFHKLDTNRDNQLSLAEFLAAIPNIQMNESAQDLLRRFDTNHDGKVSPDEFRAADVAKFDKLDLNHDGIVTPDEARRANGGK
jgi:hypothetical protein